MLILSVAYTRICNLIIIGLGAYNDRKAEDVDNVMDDIREEMDVANEVFDAIGQPLNGEAIDETDLDSGMLTPCSFLFTQ